MKTLPRRRGRPAALVVLCLAVSALANQFSWTGGGGNNNWGNANNWSPTNGAPPVAGDDVIIDDTDPRATVQVNADNRQVKSLFLGDGHTLDLAKNLLVKVTGQNDGLLTFEGVVSLKDQNDTVLEAEFIVVYSEDEETIIQLATGETPAADVILRSLTCCP